MGNRRSVIAFLTEAASILAVGATIVLFLRPVIAPELNGIGEALFDSMLLSILSGPLIIWRALIRIRTSRRNLIEASVRSNRWWAAVSVAVAMIGMVVTGTIAEQVMQSTRDAAYRYFQRLTECLAADIQNRFEHTANRLRDLRGLYSASVTVNPDEFRSYVASVTLDDELRGVLGVGYLEYENAATPGIATGSPQSNSSTAGNASNSPANRLMVRQMYPQYRNAEYWGVDVSANPVLRESAQRAIDFDLPTISAAVRLDARNPSQKALWCFLPLFARGESPQTTSSRRENITGLLCIRIDLESAIRDTVNLIRDDLDFEIFDGPRATLPNLAFDLDGHMVDAGNEEAMRQLQNRMFRQSTAISLGGRTWTLVSSTTRSFEARVDQTTFSWIWLTGTLFSMLSGICVWLLGTSGNRARWIARDMTEQLNRLSMVARRTTNAVIITDSQQRIEWVNEGFTRITGYTLDEVIGKNPGRLLRCERTDRNVASQLASTLRAGKGCRFELLNRGKFGHEYILEIEIQPIHDVRGALTGFMAIESDITEQVMAREALAASEAHVRAIIDTALDAVVSMDTVGNVTQWNKQAESTFGWTCEEAVGRTLAELIFPVELRAAHLTALRRYRETGDSAVMGRRIETPAVKNDGTQIIVELAINPVHHGGGLTFAAFIRDITPRKQAEEALQAARVAAEAASRAKSEFLANMSHEIRTPMTAIIGYASLLAELGDQPDAMQQRPEYIDTIRRNGEHLLAIINDILDLSKIEAGRMTVERIEMNPEQILLDVESLMSVKAKSKGLKLEIERATPIPKTILSDAVRFRQVLVNLVGNALKFTVVGGIKIRASLDSQAENGPLLRIDISDTGIGMAEEQTSKLFGAFVQADNSTTRRFGGTGLGLRISRSLSRMLGGDLTCLSELGRGSTFTFTVQTGSLQGIELSPAGPINRILPTPLNEPLHTEGADSLRGMRIFLAEDGPDNQRLIAFHLRKAGAEVSVFENGRMTLEALTADGTIDGPLHRVPPCDFVLTDMQMPELDGYGLARTLRAKGWSRAIVALTAHAMTGDAEKCLAAGCDDYITKPIDRNRLLDACRRAAIRSTHWTGESASNRA